MNDQDNIGLMRNIDAAFGAGDMQTILDASRHRLDQLSNRLIEVLSTITDRTAIQCRAEIFSFFNRTNSADVPSRIAFMPAFGRYSSALNSRQVQFALNLKLLF